MTYSKARKPTGLHRQSKQLKLKALKLKPLYAALLPLFMLGIYSPVQADDWNVPTGDWAIDTNWVDGSKPTAGDDAFIDNGGTAEVTTTGEEAAQVIVGAVNTGTLNIIGGGSVSNTSGLIGEHVGSAGTVTVDGAGSSWANSDFLFVGIRGVGSLDIANGGSVSNADGFIGRDTDSTGVVTVDGADSSWTNSAGVIVGREGSGTLNITNGGSVSSFNGNIGTLAGSTGDVTVDGANSNWSLSTGLVVGNIGAGTLGITNGGSVSTTVAILGFAVDGTDTGTGTVTVDGADASWTNSGTFLVGRGGAGTLNISNSGIVNAADTMTIGERAGATGTLNIGTGGAAGILNTASINGGDGTATLNFNHTDANHFFTSDGTNGGTAINITGSTVVNQIGTGTTVLTGTNTYTGGTTVSTGTLQGTTDSLQGDITNNAALVFDQTTDGTYADVISGAGGLVKSNTGSINLTGTNTYTGATTVNGGTLFVNGSIANSATTINAGGTLGGNGLLADVFVGGGIIAPGNSIGTINVANIDFTGAGQYEVEVNAAGGTDLINATGTANLTTGTVNVLAEAGNYNISTDYTILTAAGGLGGTEFASVGANLAFLDSTLSYDANNVFLNLTRNSVALSDGGIAETKNQIAVATNLETNLLALQDITNNIIPLSAAGARDAFDSLSGVQHTHSQLATHQISNQFKQVFVQRGRQAMVLASNTQANPLDNVQVADAGNDLAGLAGQVGETPDYQHGWWLQGFGNYGDIDHTTNASGAYYDSTGIAFGIDTSWQDGIIGIAGSYAKSDVNAKHAKLDIDSYQVALYGLWDKDNYYMNGSLGLGYHKTDVNRYITVGALNSKAESDYHSTNLNASFEIGKPMLIGNNSNTTVTPFAGIDYNHLRREGFEEKGAATANLDINSETEDSLRTSLGVRLSHAYTTSNGMHITPYGSAAYIYEHMDTTSRLDAAFTAAPSSSFKIDGTRLSHNRGQFSLGVNGQLNNNTTLNIAYTGELAGSDEHHSLAATVKVGW